MGRSLVASVVAGVVAVAGAQAPAAVAGGAPTAGGPPIAPPPGLHAQASTFYDGQRLHRAPAEPVVRQAVGQELVPLRIRVLDADGAPFAHGTVSVVNVEEMNYGFYPDVPLDASGEATVDVNPAPYAVFAHVYTPPTAGRPETVTIAAVSEVAVAGATDVVLDARGGRPVEVPAPAQLLQVVDAGIVYARGDRHGSVFSNGVFPTAEELAGGQVLVKESEGARTGEMEMAGHWRLRGDGELYDLLLRSPHLTPRQPVRQDEVKPLDATYRPLQGPVTAAEVRFPSTDLMPFGVPSRIDEVPLPTQRREWVTPGPDVRWSQCIWVPPAEQHPRPFCEDDHASEGREAAHHDRLLMPRPALVTAWQLTGENRLFAETGLGEGLGLAPVFPEVGAARLRLYRDDTLLGESPDVFGWFDVPPGPGRYTLDSEVE